MTRRTDQKAAIREVITGSDRPLTAPEILELAGEIVSGIGIATVYRNVKNMVASGRIVTVDLPGEPTRYEASGLAHHHHFQCDACGRVFDVPGCTGGVRDLVPHGFELRTHEIVMYGLCEGCN